MSKNKGQPPAAPMQATGKIGLWGAPGSGKTTFLAALSIAANRASGTRDNRLLLFGADDASTDFLIQQTTLLTRDMRFPRATDAEQHLNWVLRMNIASRSRGFWRSAEAVPFEFELDVLDAPGGRYKDRSPGGSAAGEDAQATNLRLFGSDTAVAAAPQATGGGESFMTDLASCDGLVLLFDPAREWEESDAFSHFYGTLLKIAQRRLRDPARTTDLLPQYVAVCATKFDHNDVYRKACDLGFRSYSTSDRHFFPKVSDHLAEKFFLAMGRVAPRSNAELIRDTLRKFFEEDRVQFFVSSAVGFRVDPDTGIFNEREFENVDERSESKPRIKGPIYPINVIEPLTWLGGKLAAGGWAQ